MAIRPFRWFRRHPILTVFLTMFTYAWIKWMTLPPDWYLIHTFPWKKEKLDKLVVMFNDDSMLYNGVVIGNRHDTCCIVRLNDFGDIKRSTTSKHLPEDRVQDYATLMRQSGILQVRRLQRGYTPVWITIDYYFVGGSVDYIYSEDNLTDCVQQLFKITGGIPAYDCTRLDEHWYLFHIE